MEPHLDPFLSFPAPNPEAPVAPATPVEVAPAPDAVVVPSVEPVQGVAVVDAAVAPGPRAYPSLYDTTSTTILAVVFGISIVGGIQLLVKRLWSTASSEHVYLTRFVTTLVALIVGCYIADLLIAGPDTSLLSDGEKTLILTFVKDTALMIFSYYFGLKAQAPKEEQAP